MHNEEQCPDRVVPPVRPSSSSEDDGTRYYDQMRYYLEQAEAKEAKVAEANALLATVKKEERERVRAQTRCFLSCAFFYGLLLTILFSLVFLVVDNPPSTDVAPPVPLRHVTAKVSRLAEVTEGATTCMTMTFTSLRGQRFAVAEDTTDSPAFWSLVVPGDTVLLALDARDDAPNTAKDTVVSVFFQGHLLTPDC